MPTPDPSSSAAAQPVKLTVDDSEFAATLARIHASIAKVRDSAGEVGQALQGAGARFNLGPALEQARTSMGKFKETIGAIGESIGGMGEELAKSGLEAFADGIKNAMEQGRQFADQARQTSQSVSTMVELQKAFEAAGASGDDVTGAIFSLNKALSGAGEGGKPAAEAFARLGLSIGDLKKMNAAEQFSAISHGMQSIPAAAGRAAAAQQIFGEKARDIMGVLNDPRGFDAAVAGSAGLGQAMQAGAGSFEKVGKSVAQVQTTMQQFFAEVAGGVAPALSGLFDLIKKINIPEIGANLGRGISFAFEAFKEGKVFDMIRLSLTIAFKEAVNSLYKGIMAIGAAAGVIFSSLPRLLTDMFSTLSNPDFWKGIGNLLLGAIKSIQGELAKIFFGLVDMVGNKIADMLEKVPGMEGIVDKLRAAMNADNDVVQGIADKATKEGQAQMDQGKTEVQSATSNLTNDAGDTAQKAAAAAKAKFQSTQGLLDASSDISLRNSEIKNAVTNVVKDQQDNSVGAEGSASASTSGPTNTKPTPPIPATTEASIDEKKKSSGKENQFAGFKAPEADRYAKLGLFIGGAPLQMPGLSEARRTAKATEEMRGLLKQLVGQGGKGATCGNATYA